MARPEETTRPRRSDGTRQGWDRRYAAADRIHATPVPNRFLVSEIAGLAPGAALDLACGAGRNAVWLAERGWRVTGVDFSGVALGIARDLAASRGVEVEWVESDVTGWTPARARLRPGLRPLPAAPRPRAPGRTAPRRGRPARGRHAARGRPRSSQHDGGLGRAHLARCPVHTRRHRGRARRPPGREGGARAATRRGRRCAPRGHRRPRPRPPALTRAERAAGRRRRPRLRIGSAEVSSGVGPPSSSRARRSGPWPCGTRSAPPRAGRPGIRSRRAR